MFEGESASLSAILNTDTVTVPRPHKVIALHIRPLGSQSIQHRSSPMKKVKGGSLQWSTSTYHS